MSSYYNVGGLRLKISGRASKDKVKDNLETVLNALTRDHDLESFSGINIYLQLYDDNGERLALIKNDQEIVKTIDITSIKKDFSLNNIDCSLITVAEIKKQDQQQEQLWKEESKRKAEVREKQNRLRLEQEKKEKDELSRLSQHICNEFDVKRVYDVVSSIGRIIQTRSILKYISKDDIPNCGYVYRASMKNIQTKEIYAVRIYDNNHNLISNEPYRKNAPKITPGQ